MDGMPRKQKQPVAAAQPAELVSPQFDETAVAVAQPVELLPPTRLSLANLSLQPLAIVLAFGLVLILVSVTAGFLIARSERAAAREAASSAAQPSQPAPTEIPPAPVLEPAAAAAEAAGDTDSVSVRARKVGKFVRSQNRVAPIIVTDEGRPGARKVGELRYGRSPEP